MSRMVSTTGPSAAWIFSAARGAKGRSRLAGLAPCRPHAAREPPAGGRRAVRTATAPCRSPRRREFCRRRGRERSSGAPRRSPGCGRCSRSEPCTPSSLVSSAASRPSGALSIGRRCSTGRRSRANHGSMGRCRGRMASGRRISVGWSSGTNFNANPSALHTSRRMRICARSRRPSRRRMVAFHTGLHPLSARTGATQGRPWKPASSPCSAPAINAGLSRPAISHGSAGDPVTSYSSTTGESPRHSSR